MLVITCFWFNKTFTVFSINIKLTKLIFIEFIEVTSVHKTIPASSAQLNKTSSAHCIVHPSPKAKSLSIRIYTLFAHLHQDPLFPSGYHTLLSVSMCYVYILFSLISSLSFSPSTPFPSDSSQSVLCVYDFISVLLISLFCLTDMWKTPLFLKMSYFQQETQFHKLCSIIKFYY